MAHLGLAYRPRVRSCRIRQIRAFHTKHNQAPGQGAFHSSVNAHHAGAFDPGRPGRQALTDGQPGHASRGAIEEI